MAALYIWVTIGVVVTTIVATGFGSIAVFIAFIFPLLTAPVLAVISYLPTVSIGLVCGLPAVLIRRWPIAAIAALALGGWIFAQVTVLMPQKSESAVQAVAKMLETPTPLTGGTLGHVALYNGGNFNDFSCSNLCQRLLLDAGAETVSIRNNANEKDAITFRKAYGADCTMPATSQGPCVLLARNRDQTPDISIRKLSGSEIFGGSIAGPAGIANKESWVLITAEGQKIPANPGYLRPATGWKLEPAWMQGGLDQLDRRGLVRARKTVGGKPEHLAPFLRRAGLTLGDTRTRRPIRLQAMLTPAALEDALAGPLPARLRGVLERN